MASRRLRGSFTALVPLLRRGQPIAVGDEFTASLDDVRHLLRAGRVEVAPDPSQHALLDYEDRLLSGELHDSDPRRARWIAPWER